MLVSNHITGACSTAPCSLGSQYGVGTDVALVKDAKVSVTSGGCFLPKKDLVLYNMYIVMYYGGTIERYYLTLVKTKGVEWRILCFIQIIV